MVSKARLDLPEPDNPVTTISLSRGSSTFTFWRLCTRAPCTAMVVRAAALTALELIGRFSQVDECQFFDGQIAHLSELDRRGCLADQATVGQVLARRGDPFHIEIAFEVGFDLSGRAGLPHLLQMIEQRGEQGDG